VQHVVFLLFDSVRRFLTTRLMFHNFHFMFVFCFLFCVFCDSVSFVLFCVLFLLLCCRFPIFVQAYRALPPGGNPIAVNKYHIISYHITS